MSRAQPFLTLFNLNKFKQRLAELSSELEDKKSQSETTCDITEYFLLYKYFLKKKQNNTLSQKKFIHFTLFLYIALSHTFIYKLKIQITKKNIML